MRSIAADCGSLFSFVLEKRRKRNVGELKIHLIMIMQ